jgi:hypothetical protein
MSDAPERLFAAPGDDGWHAPYCGMYPEAGAIEYVLKSAVAAAVAAAREEGVSLGLLAAADIAARRAEEMENDQRHGGAMDVIDTIREITADPARVAAIATINQGD